METKYENDKAELAAKVTMSPRYQLFLSNENQDRLTDTAHTRIQNEQYGLKHTAKSTDPALSEGSTVTRTTDSGLDSTVGSEPGHEINPNLGPSTNPNKTDRGEATEFVGGNYSEALSIKVCICRLFMPWGEGVCVHFFIPFKIIQKNAVFASLLWLSELIA